MEIPDRYMSQFMCEHGCPCFLIRPELTEAYRGVTIHWRDINGHWFTARWRPSTAQFDVVEEGSERPIAGAESAAEALTPGRTYVPLPVRRA